MQNYNSKSKLLRKQIVVIYHLNCADGFGGAWAAWKYFGSKADYIGIQPGSAPIQGLKNKEIYFIDVIYKPEAIKKLIKNNKRVTAIDHHISGEQAVKMTECYSYAVGHSGSVLAWQYFHSNKPVPKLLLYIEDMDLWKFKLAHSQEINAFVDLYDFDFRKRNELAALIESKSGFRKAVGGGRIVLMHEQKLVDRMIKDNAELVSFEGYKILAINSPNFVSRIGDFLRKINPPLAIIWSERAGKIIVSLRSDGSVNVSKIAVRYGGGGHKAAAAFSFPAGRDFPWKILK